MSTETRNADRTLRAFQKRRSTPACYPCFRRKVKCRGGRPCEACIERKHPDICHVEELSKGCRRHPKGKVKKSPETRDQSVESHRTEPHVEEPNMGELSSIKFIKNNLNASNGGNDALYAMGIGISEIPISLPTLNGNTYDQKELIPRRSELLQYYTPFRDLIMPLYPIVPDPMTLELLIEDLLAGKATQMKFEKLALVLSCLALGVQFTEAQVDGRWEASKDLIIRANTFLQKANAIFEPSLEVVQALLMIGLGLQNLGLSNGAWNLLGLTYRCAQSLGLHQCTDKDKTGDHGAMLWVAITHQDCLMSLRYDRTPLTPTQQSDDPIVYTGPSLQPYHHTISKICRVSIHMLHRSPNWRREPRNASWMIDYLENVVATAPDHLSPLYTTRTLQEKFQYYAIRLHSSMLSAELCRPSFSIHVADSDHSVKEIRQKGVHYLSMVVESFLELCIISNIPFKSWSQMQAAVSCALVLALIDSKHPLPKTQSLLRRLVDTLRTSDISGILLPTRGLKEHGASAMHEKSADLLESILDRTNNLLAHEGEASTSSATVERSPPELTVNETSYDLDFDEYLNWPTELSLFNSTFSDAMLQANLDMDTYDS